MGVIFVLQALASWAAAATLVEVLGTSEGGLVHLGGLVALLVCWWRDRRAGPPDPKWVAASQVLLAAYAAAAVFGPRLVALALALTSLATLLVATTRAPARCTGLVAIAWTVLPVLDVAQALVGTPLRLAAGRLAAGMLTGAGWRVESLGVALTDGQRTVFVDPACSGVRFLWCGLFLAALLGTVLRLSAYRVAALGALSMVAVIVANALRTSALYAAELLPRGELSSPVAHEVIGLVSFALPAVLLAAFAIRLRPREETLQPLRPPEESP